MFSSSPCWDGSRESPRVIVLGLAAASLVVGDVRRADVAGLRAVDHCRSDCGSDDDRGDNECRRHHDDHDRHYDDCRYDHDDRDRRCDPHDAYDRGDDHDELDDDVVLQHVLDYDDRRSARPGADHRWWQHSGQHVVPRAAVPDRDHKRGHRADDGTDDIRRASAGGVSAARRRTHRRVIRQRRRRLDRH